MAAVAKNEQKDASKEKKDKDWFAEDIGTMEKYNQLANDVKFNPTSLLRSEIVLEIFDSMEQHMKKSKDSNLVNGNGLNNMTIWDFGAGTGVFTKIFLNLIKEKEGKVSHVIASDLSQTACKYLEKELSDNVKNGELSIINNTTTDIKNENNKHKIDILWMAFTLHHLEGDDKAALLKNIKNNLKISGGKFIAFEFSPERAKNVFALKAEIDKIKQSDAAAVAAKKKRQTKRKK